MILNDVIVEVRRIIQDETVTYRYSDVFLLGLCNQTLKRIAVLRPDLFAYFGTMTCTEDAVLQSAPSDSARIIEVHGVVGGNRLIEVNREVMDQNSPDWANDTSAAATNWMRHVRNSNRFYIYPPAPAAQDLDIEYVQIPTTYDGTTPVTLLPDLYYPAVIDGVVFLVESSNDESISDGRAKMFQSMFNEALVTSLQSRTITDTESSGMRTGRSILSRQDSEVL